MLNIFMESIFLTLMFHTIPMYNRLMLVTKYVEMSMLFLGTPTRTMLHYNAGVKIIHLKKTVKMQILSSQVNSNFSLIVSHFLCLIFYTHRNHLQQLDGTNCHHKYNHFWMCLSKFTRWWLLWWREQQCRLYLWWRWLLWR